METLIHSVSLVSGGSRTEHSWVRLHAGRVAHVGVGDSWREALPTGTDVVDGSGRILTPGLIDIHGHGGGGHSYDEGLEATRTALDAHLAEGTTRQVLSLVAAPIDVLCAQLAAVGQAVRADPRVLGAHLEGPFFSPSHSGAHKPEYLAEPAPAHVARLIEAGDGVTRQITLAPELPGALDAVAAFVEAGVRVAVGHTDATYEQALAAFDRGATILTHAFNAMPPVHHRAPSGLAPARHPRHAAPAGHHACHPRAAVAYRQF